MKKITSNLSGLKYTLAGLSLIAVIYAITEIILFFNNVPLWHWCRLGINVVAWILILFGCYIIRPIRIEFKRSFFVSIGGLVMEILTALLVFNEYRQGLGDTAFIDLAAMFTDYLADIAMLAVYLFVVRGMGQLLASNGMGSQGKKSIKLSKIGIGVILASYVVTPFAYILPVVLEYILAIISIGANVFMSFAMIYYVNSAYKELED